MFTRILPALPIIAAAVFVLPAQAQGQPAPNREPESYDYQQQPTYDRGQTHSAYYEFDRDLLDAANGCAFRAARANLSRVVVQEVDRTASNRYQVAGRAQRRGYSGPGSVSPNDRSYRPRSVSFTCTADSRGRVISWAIDRR